MAWNSRKNTKPEAKIEKYLEDKVLDLGGMCPKWTSPGMKGVPDRIVFMPGGLTVFVELKREKGGVISPIQAWRAQQLTNLGQKVFFIHTREQIDRLIECLMQGVIPDVL